VEHAQSFAPDRTSATVTPGVGWLTEEGLAGPHAATIAQFASVALALATWGSGGVTPKPTY